MIMIDSPWRKSVARPPLDYHRRFGLRLRELRKRRALTQQALGTLAGLHYKFIGGIERGEENPTLAVIVKLATALGVPPQALLELDHVDSTEKLRDRAMDMIEHSPASELPQLVKALRLLTS